MKTHHIVVLVAGGALAAYFATKVAKQGLAGAASDLGTAAVNAVGGLFTGGVLGIGDAVGLPRTNASAGQTAWNNGNYLEASKLLPAAAFIGNVWDGLTGGNSAPAVDPRLAQAQENVRLYGGTLEGWLGYDYYDQDAVNPRTLSGAYPSKWGTRTTAGFPWER